MSTRMLSGPLPHTRGNKTTGLHMTCVDFSLVGQASSGAAAHEEAREISAFFWEEAEHNLNAEGAIQPTGDTAEPAA